MAAEFKFANSVPGIEDRLRRRVKSLEELRASVEKDLERLNRAIEKICCNPELADFISDIRELLDSDKRHE